MFKHIHYLRRANAGTTLRWSLSPANPAMPLRQRLILWQGPSFQRCCSQMRMGSRGRRRTGWRSSIDDEVVVVGDRQQGHRLQVAGWQQGTPAPATKDHEFATRGRASCCSVSCSVWDQGRTMDAAPAGVVCGGHPGRYRYLLRWPPPGGMPQRPKALS